MGNNTLLEEELRNHRLVKIICFPVIHSDVSYCSCGWRSTISPTVQVSVNSWFDHVMSSGVTNEEENKGSEPQESSK